jgi:hypothetical protein
LVDVEERYRNHLTFLNDLYEEAEGSEIPLISMWEIGEKIVTGGFSSAESVNIVNWLIGEDSLNGVLTAALIRPYNKELAILIRQLRLLNSNMRVLLELSGR